VAATRVISEFTFRSTSGGADYFWEVVQDEQGLIQVRHIRAPTGLIRDTVTGLPQTVVDDIDESVRLVQALVSETTAASGTLTFTGETFQDAVIAGGVLNNTEYRVIYSSPDNVLFTTTNKTTTGFRAETSTAYGSPSDPKDVDYTVLVATAQASTFSGTVTFTDAETTGQIAVAFGTAFATASYRVHLTPDDFVLARVIDKTTTGFTIELGVTMDTGQTLDVGYDVFV